MEKYYKSETKGVITSKEIKRGVALSYEYTVKYCVKQECYYVNNLQRMEEKKYQIGDSVSIRYASSDPSYAIVNEYTETYKPFYWSLAGLIVLLICLFFRIRY